MINLLKNYKNILQMAVISKIFKTSSIYRLLTSYCQSRDLFWEKTVQY